MSASVTVIVPTKDRREVLEATLRSVFAQTVVDLHVIVVDDGSTDGTAESLSADPRVEVVRHDAPQGAAASRNDGLARVTTEWVAFCDDDDLWAPTKLARQLDALAAAPEAGWCCTDAVCVDAELRVIEDQHLGRGGDVLALLLQSNDIPGGGSSVLARASLVREVGGFVEDLPSSEDWDLWIRLAAASPLAVVTEPLVGYRIWSGGKSRQVMRMEAAFSTIQERYRHEARRCSVEGDLRSHQRYLGKQALRGGDRVGAARCFVRSGRVGRAAFALVAPRLMDRVGSARMRRAISPARVSAANAWLRALDAASTR